MDFIKLFFYRPFLGVNITQFFDTLCNNFLRNAITAAVIFGLIQVNDDTVVSSLMVAVLMLPSFLFMETAGEIADKYPKDLIIKILKMVQCFVALLACIGFSVENIWILLAALFLMGTCAAFLSPAKYSILPEILPQKNLLAANGMVQMMVFAAILGGTILGGMIFSVNIYFLYTFLIVASIIGFLSALIIPRQKQDVSTAIVHKNLLTAIRKNIAFAYEQKNIMFCIIGISWFWFVGTVVISQIPTFTKELLNGDNTVFTLFIALFSIGIGVGTIICQLISRGSISNKLLAPCLWVIVFSLADLFYVSIDYTAPENKASFDVFLLEWQGVRIVLDIFVFSVAGGVYIVPLTTMLQIFSPDNTRARIIAANNIINALFMIAGSVFCALLLLIKVSIPAIFAILSGLNVLAAILYYQKKHQD